MKFFDFLSKKKRTEKKRKEALAGKTTSGHLDPGERDRMFRNRNK